MTNDPDPTYIKLDAFEGPLDLLLHLIKKNEVDIYDIPIVVIADQYLKYTKFMNDIDLDRAGEFLILAATLLQIKSKMLLPSTEEDKEINGGGEEQEDPRSELLNRLLEYQRYKDAALELDQREILGRNVFLRGLSHEEPPPSKENNFKEATLFDLIEAFRKITLAINSDRFVEIKRENVDLGVKMKEIMDKLKAKDNIVFQSLFRVSSQREDIVITFLAILELIRLKMIKVYQVTANGIIKIYYNSS